MNTNSKSSRSTLENRASQLGLQLSEAGRQVRYEAASNNEPLPRWELSDGRNQSTVRGYKTLAEVAQALDEQEIVAGA